MKRYTLDNFIVSKHNELAHSAAESVILNPGRTYNPVFVFGRPGVGKTHLLKAIEQYLQENSPEIEVVYATAADFVNEYIESIKLGSRSSVEEFKRKYRACDVLLLDDVQFLLGKHNSQQALIYTLKELELKNKQIVVTSDLPPKDLAMDEILKSLFVGGLLCEIGLPDYQTRLEILHKLKEIYSDVEIEEEALTFIARNISSNVRALEGALKSFYIWKKKNGEKKEVENYEIILADYLQYEEKSVIEPDDIINSVIQFYGIEKKILCGKSRTRSSVEARNVAMYLMRELIGLPYTKIGQYFKRTHSTVLSALEQMNSTLKENDSQVKRDIIAILEKIG